jgi:Flp pilus assembly protein TadG
MAMPPSKRTKLTGRRGTAAVEFALVLPLLLALLFGIIEFGMLFKDQLAILQAAREGSRIAAVGRPIGEIQARITSSASTITLAYLTYDIMSRTYSNGAWTTWVPVGDKTDGSGTNDAVQGAQIRIRCTYQHALLTGPLFANLIGRPGASSVPLYATMVMRRE